jgi:putative colanic acid biosynthesis glycosyltransferase WcaI
MRILFVNQYFPPDATNTAYLLGELSEDLARDHEVWVLSGRPSYNPEASTYRPTGVHVRHAWSTSFSRAGMAGRLVNYGSYLGSAALSALRVPRPDVVVALTDPPVIGAVGLMAARRHRVPFVQVYMDIYPDVGIALGRVDHPLLVRLWRRLNHSIRSRAARVVAIGRDMVEKLEDEGVEPAKIALLPNWADESGADASEALRARTARGWEDRFVVMHAGNVGLAQNLGLVIAAAERLRDRPDVHIVLLGEGAARGRLEDDASARGLSNVSFLPHVPRDEAHALIAAADLHLVSLVPGLRGCVVPSKLYGILAAAKPFVAAVEQGSELDRLIEEHRCGARVDPGDDEGLARTILTLREHPDPQMGRRGRRAFEASYRRETATSSYRAMLEDVASGPSSLSAAAPLPRGASRKSDP